MRRSFLLAAAGVLLVLSGRVSTRPEPPFSQRAVLVAGIVVFSAVALAVFAAGAAPFALPGKWAIYAIEGALLVSIALALVLLFAGGGGLERGRE